MLTTLFRRATCYALRRPLSLRGVLPLLSSKILDRRRCWFSTGRDNIFDEGERKAMEAARSILEKEEEFVIVPQTYKEWTERVDPML